MATESNITHRVASLPLYRLPAEASFAMTLELTDYDPAGKYIELTAQSRYGRTASQVWRTATTDDTPAISISGSTVTIEIARARASADDATLDLSDLGRNVAFAVVFRDSSSDPADFVLQGDLDFLPDRGDFDPGTAASTSVALTIATGSTVSVEVKGVIEGEAGAVTSVVGETGAVTASQIKTAYESLADTNAYTDAEKSKLAGIESSATADQTGAEIKAAYEGEADTNAYTDAEKSKLAGIEASATADQTGAEIKAAYEGEADTNAYTDAEKSKLAGIEASATADQTGAEIKAAYEGEADTNAYTDAEKSKLAGLEAFDSSDYATSAQGALADSAVQPGDVVDDLTTGGSAVPGSAAQLVVLKGLIDNINNVLASDETTLDTLQEVVDFIELNRADLDALGISSIAGLQSALDGKAASSHNHTLSEVTDAGTSASLDVPAAGDAAAGEVVKGDDSRLTDARTPASHTHTMSDITDAGGLATEDDVEGTAVKSTGETGGSKFLREDGDGTCSWQSVPGGGDMLASTYDPGSVSEQMVGLTAAQTLTNKTLTTPTITLKQGTAPAPTAEGDIQWDTDDNQIKVGDGAATKVFSDDSQLATAAQGALADSAVQPGDNVSDLVNDSGFISSVEGTAVLSTGETGGTKFLREDGDGTCSWQTIAGGGDMLASTYDPGSVSEQVVGLTATQTLTNKTLTTPTITLKQGTAPAPTAEGDIQWDTDDNQIKVGDGAATKVFSDDSQLATAAQGALASSAQQPPSEGAFVDGDKTKLDGIESGATAEPASVKAGEITIVINNPTAGVAGYHRIPKDYTINSASILASGSCSAVVDIWVDSITTDPPTDVTDADSITASAQPTLSSEVYATDGTLTGWTTSLTEGHWMAWNVDSVSGDPDWIKVTLETTAA